MAGATMTFTYDTEGPIKRIIADWLSDDADGTTSGDSVKVSGYLLRAVTDPGSAAPTANYDISLDADNVERYGSNLYPATHNTGRISLQHARNLATQAVVGASRLAQLKPDNSLDNLRNAVTSPGGTTAAAIASFEQDEFSNIIQKAVSAAINRGKELGEQA